MYIHCSCGMCGKTMGRLEINENGMEFDKELTAAINRNTMFNGSYVCHDCYDMVRHLSDYVRKNKE